MFIRLALQQHFLPSFTDADGRFQFVYVKDAAEAVLRCLGNERAYGQSFNLCGDEILDYGMFFETLGGICRAGNGSEVPGGGLAEIPLTLAEAEEKGIPVPFPATAGETELVSNKKSREVLEMNYTDFQSGMRKTFNAFRHVFGEN